MCSIKVHFKIMLLKGEVVQLDKKPFDDLLRFSSLNPFYTHNLQTFKIKIYGIDKTLIANSFTTFAELSEMIYSYDPRP